MLIYYWYIQAQFNKKNSNICQHISNGEVKRRTGNDGLNSSTNCVEANTQELELTPKNQNANDTRPTVAERLPLTNDNNSSSHQHQVSLVIT